MLSFRLIYAAPARAIVLRVASGRSRCRADARHLVTMAHGTAYPHGLKCLSPVTTMDKALALLGPKFEVSAHQKSQFVKPASINYDFNGKSCKWDIVESHASVGVVLHHTSLDAFLIVRQFRPAVYASALRTAAAAGTAAPGFREGFTYELCAGIVDKPGLSLTEICKEEVAEECGYQVEASSLVSIGPAMSAVGISGSRHDMYFTEVNDSMRIPDSGGGHVETGEYIELLALPLESTQVFLSDASLPKSPSLMYGLLWAFHQVKDKQRQGGAMETGALELGSVLTA